MRITHSTLLLSFLFLLIIFSQKIDAQTTFSFKIDTLSFNGSVKDAVVITADHESYVKIDAADGGKAIVLYLGLSKLNKLPASLPFKHHDHTKGETTDSEFIWIPEGKEGAKWISSEGKTIVTQYDSVKKTLSGSFEYTVQKSERAKDKPRQKLEVTKGLFHNVQYRTEETEKGK